jgi:major vault protein
MPPNDTEKKDLTLSPGEYAYVQDLMKGSVKAHIGPINISLGPQDVPTTFDLKGGFKVVPTLRDAVRKSPTAVEGFYIELLNPTKDPKESIPEQSKVVATPELDVGRKVNLPGPQMFALYPGQSAKVIRGHRMRSNQYLVIQVYNVEEAKKNWSKAIVKGITGENKEIKPPENLAVGQRFNIKGTEVSFYIPPTGIQVIPVEGQQDAKGRPQYIREALSLEQMEYSILVDENGKKRYPRGPAVVFPEPTEAFIGDPKDMTKTKWRAYELNAIQGIHVTVIADYDEDTGEKDKDGKPITIHRKAGEEIFIKGGGKDTIYFPREEHMLIRYDGNDKHFGVAIPSGEARYVMDRFTGEIKTVKGPAVYLPDPRREVFVRRALTQDQCTLWYPGNQAVLEYNMKLGEFQLRSPTTRSGVVSEGDFMRQSGAVSSSMADSLSNELNRLESFANYSSSSAGPQSFGGAAIMAATPQTARAGMSVSKQNQKSSGIVGDTSERSEKATFQRPRSLVLNTKLEGVPMVKPWVGYAVMVVSKGGKKRVEQGPNTVLLDYDEELEILALSTGKPKSQDRILRTVYLQVRDNKVSDIVEVTTSDHVKVQLHYSLNVVFEGDSNKWFSVMNYTKLITDHVRSILKSAIRKQTIEEFYLNAAAFIRDTILGKPTDKTPRPGMAFDSNNSRVTDVDILDVVIQDGQIAASLEEVARFTVQQNINLNREKRKLEVVKATQELERQSLIEQATTILKANELEISKLSSNTNVELEKFKAEESKQVEFKKLDELKASVADAQTKAILTREEWKVKAALSKATAEQELRLAALAAETKALQDRMTAGGAGLGEVVAALHNRDTLTKVAEAISVQRFIGGNSLVDAIQKALGENPLGSLLGAAVQRAADGLNNGTPKAQPEKAARG